MQFERGKKGERIAQPGVEGIKAPPKAKTIDKSGISANPVGSIIHKVDSDSANEQRIDIKNKKVDQILKIKDENNPSNTISSNQVVTYSDQMKKCLSNFQLDGKNNSSDSVCGNINFPSRSILGDCSFGGSHLSDSGEYRRSTIAMMKSAMKVLERIKNESAPMT
jgi:hypothetical protein